MNPAIRRLVALMLAAFAGVVCGECVCHYPQARNAIGKLAGRGKLLAIARGVGIYERDRGDEETPVRDLIAAENLRQVSASESITQAETEQEYDLLRAQFGTDAAFTKALSESDLAAADLREIVRSNLAGRRWIQAQLGASVVTDAAVRGFHDAHREDFRLPPRVRVRHIFLIAPAGSSDDLVEAKGAIAGSIAGRLAKGEDFAALAGEFSEDEATKNRAGDLDYFAASRMPPEFVAEVIKLRVGETGKPFRSHLGFHVVQLTDLKPARELSFEEARPEVLIELGNASRAASVRQVAEGLNSADFIRADSLGD